MTDPCPITLNHGAIGNGRVLALVAPSTHIDWLCMPRVGHLAEGEAFVSFLRDVAEAGPLQPLYGIRGERELVEQHLNHLDGFCGSRSVRIGNAAWFQKQHDLMGEMILCLDTITSDPRVVIDETEPILRMAEGYRKHMLDSAYRRWVSSTLAIRGSSRRSRRTNGSSSRTG